MGLITDDFNQNGGGAERWIAGFASHLVRSGHEVHVLAFQARGAVPGPIPHVLTDPGTPLARARAVEALVSTLSPMVLYDGGTSWSGHVSHPHTGSALLSLDREIASHVPWRRLRAALSPRLNSRRHEMARVERRAAASASRIIALSARLRVLLSARHALPADRLTVIPNGVDTIRFSPDRLAPSRAAARAELGAGEALLCLMVAHNLRLKGFDTALRAIAPLVARGADIRLIVAGGMPDRAWSGLTAAMGLASRVVFTGDVPDIERLYAAADILVHPTRWADPADGVDRIDRPWLRAAGVTDASINAAMIGGALGTAKDALAAGQGSAARAALRLLLRCGPLHPRTNARG